VRLVDFLSPGEQAVFYGLTADADAEGLIW
jgi:hypothetical protein